MTDGDNQSNQLEGAMGNMRIDEAVKQELIKINKNLERWMNRWNKVAELRNREIVARGKLEIDNLDENRRNLEGCNGAGFIESEYFTGTIDDYKLQLEFWPTGYNSENYRAPEGVCTVNLCVYPENYSGNQILSWPFKADVTIKVTNQTNPNKNKTFTKYCEIEKPTMENRSDPLDYFNRDARVREAKPDKTFKRSESFEYLYSDLAENGALPNSIIVECFVHFK